MTIHRVLEIYLYTELPDSPLLTDTTCAICQEKIESWAELVSIDTHSGRGYNTLCKRCVLELYHELQEAEKAGYLGERK